ncbi:hypothetical protein ACIO1C_30125 [Streptomyces sp. NPDC087420]|uniref:hypothetical protein n=1 Tax=Streptomyces sp. NPDC087420 TaxID=3365785 RepID=UPI003833452A
MPLTRRHTALGCAVGRYCPLGFEATWAYVTTVALPSPDLRQDPAALVRALDTLEASRAVRLGALEDFAVRRRAEKARGRRTPGAGETVHLRQPGWPGATSPSRLGLVAAVANRHTAFRSGPYPDETLSSDAQVGRLADLHARLDACASAYLTGLGHLDGPARDELAHTTSGIDALTRSGHAPLNGYLLAWLRFARLVAYASDAVRASDSSYVSGLPPAPDLTR